MVRPAAIDTPVPWKRKLSRPVSVVHRVALAAFVIATILLVVGVGWLVWAVAADGMALALWQQVLVVLALLGLLSIAAAAFRVAFFAGLARSFLR